MASKFLTSIDDLQNTKDVRFSEVNIEEWGLTVRVGSLSAGDMLEWLEANEGPAKRTAGLRLIVKSLVDEAGDRIGNDKWLEVLKKRNADVIRQLINAITKLNGLDETPAKIKNGSSEVLAAASPSDSPSA